MDVWNRMSVEQEYDHSEMASFFGSEKKEEVDVVLPDLEQQILIVEEEPLLWLFLKWQKILSIHPFSACSPKAMKVLAVIIINRCNERKSA